MVDFHSHVLPGIDDGSANAEQSAEMLRALAAQDVDTLVLTPHFYVQETDPDGFLALREKAMERLSPVLEEGMPALRLGAEVYYFRGIAHMEKLPLLRLEGTRILLLEMPFAPWTNAEVREVVSICENPAFVVMLAHVERYFKYAPADAWGALHAAGALMQTNAVSLLSWRTRGKVLRMMMQRRIQVLGTDCHNMSDRRPRMDEAVKVLEKRFGEEYVQRLVQDGSDILEEFSL